MENIDILKPVFVFYISVDHVPNSEISDFMDRTAEKLRDPRYTSFFVPVRNQNTKIECIFPKFLSYTEYQTFVNTYHEEIEKIKSQEIEFKFDPLTDMF